MRSAGADRRPDNGPPDRIVADPFGGGVSARGLDLLPYPTSLKNFRGRFDFADPEPTSLVYTSS